MLDRLHAVSEEAMLTLLHREDDDETDKRFLQLITRKLGGRAILEFVVAHGAENLQDTIAFLGEPATQADIEQPASLRLLRHYTSSIRHQQYHDADVVTIHVDVVA